MTSHAAMTSGAGVWATVNALNGGQECDFGEDVTPDYIESRNQRKRYFDDFAAALLTDNGSPSTSYCP